MHIPFNHLVPGLFVERPNRFVALVELEGQIVQAHIATSGRLRELLVPGASVLLEPSGSPARRTPYSLRLVFHQGIWVSIDAHLPNKLVRNSLLHHELLPFAQCEYVRSEPLYEHGRFDFMLTKAGQIIYLEVKSVTLVESGIGLFPDAPTERGRRHLLHLSSLVREGYRCAVIFIVQRTDADYFTANQRTDPAFMQALRKAAVSGVEAYAYRCLVSPAGIALADRIPVLI